MSRLDGQLPDAEGPRSVVVLGSTGSIGVQALSVIAAAPDRFTVLGLAGGGQRLDLLVEQAVSTGARWVAVGDTSRTGELTERLAAALPRARRPTVIGGPTAVQELATVDADVILNGITGAQGLRPTLAALRAGRTVALANKESLVAGGPLVLGAARPGQLIAVDSEHSAMAQCLRSGTAGEVRRLILTASGGPFRGRTRVQLTDVTPAQALNHPTWAMGPVISTNSATLINKGLELIEAALLFGVAYDQVQVVVHPQSIVHSMVEFTDGSTIAQASPPDMRLPIALALGWPNRVPGSARPLDWTQAQQWTFQPLDEHAFPAVELARTAGRAGGCAPAVFNAANEEAVAAFHSGRCGFLAIVDTVSAVLADWLTEQQDSVGEPRDVQDVETAQDWGRDRAHALLHR